MQKIFPFLWFDTQAQEAAEYYVKVFAPRGGDTNIIETNPMVTAFTLDGIEFRTLNGGPHPAAKFNDSISMFVTCENQKEVDYLWDRFIADGGEASRCGWLKDKYGMSWQIIPRQLMELMGKDKTGKVMQAMMKMSKIIVKDLESAYTGS